MASYLECLLIAHVWSVIGETKSDVLKHIRRNKINKLLVAAIKHNSSILVSGLFIMVATCFGHS